MKTNPLILIIEDNPTNMRLAKTALMKHEFDILTASSADEALKILVDNTPDLILMDIQLPGVDGLQLTSYLKDNPQTKDIIIIALTAYASNLDQEKAMAAGCDGFISKPYDILDLPGKLRGYLR